MMRPDQPEPVSVHCLSAYYERTQIDMQAKGSSNSLASRPLVLLIWTKWHVLYTQSALEASGGSHHRC